MIIDFDKKIHEQITPETWCSKGARYLSHDGKTISCCIMVWIIDRYNYIDRIPLYKAIDAKLGIPRMTLPMWNDARGRKFAEVYNLLKDLDI